MKKLLLLLPILLLAWYSYWWLLCVEKDYWYSVCYNKTNKQITDIYNCVESCMDVYAWTLSDNQYLSCKSKCEVSNWKHIKNIPNMWKY